MISDDENAAGLERGEQRVIHAGAIDEPALNDYLALGAGTIEVVAIPNGYDTVRVLSGLLKDVDLVLAGGRAESGAGSGLFPYALAKALGRPVVANVLDVEIEGAEARVRQFLPKGRRRGVAVSLPAILAVHPLTQVRLGYAYARRLSGRIVAVSPAIDGQLGAAVGASRVAVDDGRFSRDKQIGATGKMVSARGYIAVGISGAVQHLQGIKDCQHVIAVNRDAGAPIIGRADLSVIGDAEEVMQALLTRIAQAREQRELPEAP